MHYYYYIYIFFIRYGFGVNSKPNKRNNTIEKKIWAITENVFGYNITFI